MIKGFAEELIPGLGSQIPRLVMIPYNQHLQLQLQQRQPQQSQQQQQQQQQHLRLTGQKKAIKTKWENILNPWRRTVSHIPVSRTIQMQCTQNTHQRLHQRQKNLQRKRQQIIEERDSSFENSFYSYSSCSSSSSSSRSSSSSSMSLSLSLFLPFPYLNRHLMNAFGDPKTKSLKSTMVKPKQVSSMPLQFHLFNCSDSRQVNIPCQLMNRYSLFMRQHRKPIQLSAIRSCTVLRLLQWMQRHRHDNIQQLAHSLPCPSNPNPTWDESFLAEGGLSQLVELILACNYLGVDPLLTHATHYFGQLMVQRCQAEQLLLSGISQILTEVHDSKIINRHVPAPSSSPSLVPMETILVPKQTTFRHHQC
ncbi:alpha-protein kinase 1 isoform X2 [Drosophila tropicalis]